MQEPTAEELNGNITPGKVLYFLTDRTDEGRPRSIISVHEYTADSMTGEHIRTREKAVSKEVYVTMFPRGPFTHVIMTDDTGGSADLKKFINILESYDRSMLEADELETENDNILMTIIPTALNGKASIIGVNPTNWSVKRKMDSNRWQPQMHEVTTVTVIFMSSDIVFCKHEGLNLQEAKKRAEARAAAEAARAAETAPEDDEKYMDMIDEHESHILRKGPRRRD